MTHKTYWRDRQLSGFNLAQSVLQQEKNMLDFMLQCGIKQWRWCGDNNNLRLLCAQQYELVNYYCQGVIIFGHVVDNLTSSELCNKVRHLINDVEHVYLGINRYNISCHDLAFDLPDSMEKSIDKIVKFCDTRFYRLHSFPHVDGNHMVGSHPMDCYGL
jgi:hypothetical protein